ncbi:MAG: sterol desaturase family protein [Bacteroidota bacterium]
MKSLIPFWTLYLPLFSLAGILSLYGLFYFWKKEQLAKLKIHPHPPKDHIMKKERRYTWYSLGVFALAGLGLDWFTAQAWTQVFTDWQAFPWWYHPVSLLLIFGLNDAYFYWVHRFLHWKPIFQRVHIWHHKFHHPTPFTAFAFHPIEAVLQIGFIPLVALVLPIHSSLFLFFVSFLLLMSIYGHLGFELRANKKGIARWFNTAIHHHQHHEFFHYNYGIYLNFWDKIMGTNHPTYPEAFWEFGEQVEKKAEKVDYSQK